MGYEDAGAKQTQNYGDNFNHFTHPVTLTQPLDSLRLFQDRFVSLAEWFRAHWRRARTRQPRRA